MSTQVKQVNVLLCDICHKETYAWYRCHACGRDLCHQHGIQMTHAVHFSGSGDGYYCGSCFERLAQSKADELFNAFMVIQRLKDEQKAFYEDFKARSKAAEEALSDLPRPVFTKE